MQNLYLATPPISLTLALLGFCCLILLIFGVLVLGILARKDNTKKDTSKQEE